LCGKGLRQWGRGRVALSAVYKATHGGIEPLTKLHDSDCGRLHTV